MAARRAANAETRRRILDAAARCFARSGFRRARLEDVAARAGVSRALVYGYFESKAALLRAVRDQELAGWREAVEPGLRGAAGPGEALTVMVGETLRYARERPFLQALLADDVRELLLDEEGSSRPALDEWRRRLVEVLESGVATGELRPDLEVQATADVLRAMLLGIVDRMHRPGGPIPVAEEEHVEAALALLRHGLEEPASGRARVAGPRPGRRKAG